MNTNTHAKRIGFLATGSEIISGEILNTNGQKMAQAMMTDGMTIGEHIIVDDDENNMKRALRFMLKHHDAVITSGGLGPTSDDRTRFIVAEVSKRALAFNQESWSRIEQRLAKRNMPIPNSNKQQAYFPEEADIYINENGTADGCHITLDNQHIFMLPGPPRECLPIFHNHVLPTLKNFGFASDQRLYRWRLMGVSEAAIAEQLENSIGKQYALSFAYRAAYPYLDIKLQLPNDTTRHAVLDAVYQMVKPYLVTTEHSNISTQLKHKLADFEGVISICDLATKGHLIAELTTPRNYNKICTVPNPEQLPEQYGVCIKGLDVYWQPQPNTFETHIEITLSHRGQVMTHQHQVFLRGQESIQSAIEFCCFAILQAWLDG